MIRQVQLDEMKTRKLLEHAAKAAGYDTSHEWNEKRLHLNPPLAALCIPGVSTLWNPLEDNADAFSLAVKLKLSIRFGRRGVFIFDEEESDELAYSIFTECCDKSKLTRLAIVNAAAWLGGYRERQ